jgi:hypothetical protein
MRTSRIQAWYQNPKKHLILDLNRPMIGLRASMFRFFVLAASDLLLVFEFSVYGLSLLLLLLLFPASPVFSPQDLRRRRNVCSQGGDVRSVVVGFIPIRGSNNGKRPVAGPSVARSRSKSLISNGGPRVRITSAVFIRSKRKSTERAPTTGGITVSNIPTTCGATRLLSENGASNGHRRLKVPQVLICT